MVQGLLFILCLLPSYAAAFTYSVSNVRGTEAFVSGQGSSYRTKVQAGMILHEGDTLQTGVQTQISIVSSNGHQIQVGPRSSVSLKDAGKEKGEKFNLIELIGGSVRSIIQKAGGESKKFEIRHGAISIGVRGTDFLSTVNGEGLDVFLNEGKLLLQNEIELLEGSKAGINAGGEIVYTAAMSRFEFARAIERAGFGSDENDGSGGGAPTDSVSTNKDTSEQAENLIRKGDLFHLKALRLSTAKLNDLGNGEGALHVAARSGRVEVLSFLLDQNADVNGQDTNGKTPLMVAIERKHMPSIKVLLASGAKKTKKDFSGRTAHDYARISESREIQNLLAKD